MPPTLTRASARPASPASPSNPRWSPVA